MRLIFVPDANQTSAADSAQRRDPLHAALEAPFHPSSTRYRPETASETEENSFGLPRENMGSGSTRDTVLRLGCEAFISRFRKLLSLIAGGLLHVGIGKYFPCCPCVLPGISCGAADSEHGGVREGNGTHVLGHSASKVLPYHTGIQALSATQRHTPVHRNRQ